MLYQVSISRTGKLVKLAPIEERNCKATDRIWEEHGYCHIPVLDIVNYAEIQWEGIEFNRLLAKDGVLYRFNNWIGEYPFSEGIEIEGIGTITISKED